MMCRRKLRAVSFSLMIHMIKNSIINFGKVVYIIVDPVNACIISVLYDNFSFVSMEEEFHVGIQEVVLLPLRPSFCTTFITNCGRGYILTICPMSLARACSYSANYHPANPP